MNLEQDDIESSDAIPLKNGFLYKCVIKIIIKQTDFSMFRNEKNNVLIWQKCNQDHILFFGMQHSGLSQKLKSYFKGNIFIYVFESVTYFLREKFFHFDEIKIFFPYS